MIVLGRIGSTFGVQGWLKVQSFTELAAGILDYSPWYLSSDEENWEKVTLEDGYLQGNTVLIKFRHLDNPETARQMTGKYIGVMREQLPVLSKNQYYWSDLKGLTVINKDGSVLGHVVSIIETGSNDVLVVKGDKEIGIPYLPGKVITAVDLAKREIHVDWEPL